MLCIAVPTRHAAAGRIPGWFPSQAWVPSGRLPSSPRLSTWRPTPAIGHSLAE